MCKNIVEKGRLNHTIAIFDISAERGHEVLEQLGTQRARLADSIADAVSDADIIFFSVPNEKAVRSILAELAGLDLTDKVLADCSTVHPNTTQWEAAEVAKRGGSFVACPVFGSPTMAQQAQIITVLSGFSEGVARVRPFCEGVISRKNIDFSPSRPEKATLLKIVGNTFVLNLVVALAEAHVLAAKTGIGSEHLDAFIQTVFPGPCAAYSQDMVNGGYFTREKPMAAAELAKKDLGIAKQLAKANATPLRMIDVAEHYIDAVVRAKGSQGGITGVYGAVREEADLPFENFPQ